MNKSLNQFFGITAVICALLASSCTFGNGSTSNSTQTTTTQPGSTTPEDLQPIPPTLEITPTGLKKLDGDNAELLNTSEKQIMTVQTTITGSDLYKHTIDDKTSYGVFIEGRTVALSPFIMGQYEVTQELYGLVMGNNPSLGKDSAVLTEKQELRPVENVTWYDAIEFCNKLSQKTGLNTVYTITNKKIENSSITKADVTVDMTKNGYRLPTEAEWEFAARGGEPSTDAEAVWLYEVAYPEGSTATIAWEYNNSTHKSHQTGKLTQNKLDLYDITGNVSEWCFDSYTESLTATQDPYYNNANANRVHRGGHYDGGASDNYVSLRSSTGADSPKATLGFRLCRTVVK